MMKMKMKEKKKKSGKILAAIEDESRSCSYCHTTKTPMWRAGPTGPKSLCNACGIKYSKEIGTTEKKPRSSSSKKKKLMRERVSVLQKQSNQFGEEERAAAILLMALSYGNNDHLFA